MNCGDEGMIHRGRLGYPPRRTSGSPACEPDAAAQMSEAPSLQAGRGPRLDQTAVVGADVVDAARVKAWHRDVERAAPVARVRDETPAGRAIVEHREAPQDLLSVRPGAHARLVGVEQMNRARSVVAAA